LRKFGGRGADLERKIARKKRGWVGWCIWRRREARKFESERERRRVLTKGIDQQLRKADRENHRQVCAKDLPRQTLRNQRHPSYIRTYDHQNGSLTLSPPLHPRTNAKPHLLPSYLPQNSPSLLNLHIDHHDHRFQRTRPRPQQQHPLNPRHRKPR